jgi:hypothetical protein
VLKESEQFPANKFVQDLLELRIKELDFGPNFKNASERMSELKTVIESFNSFKEHPDEYLSEHFSKQRNKVDLAREKLILKINQMSNMLILEIDLQEKECLISLPKCNLSFLNDDLASAQADLCKWEQDMKYLVVNDNLWTSINTKCSEYMEQLKQSRLEFEENFLAKSCKQKTESHFSDLFIKQLTL